MKKGDLVKPVLENTEIRIEKVLKTKGKKEKVYLCSDGKHYYKSSLTLVERGI